MKRHFLTVATAFMALLISENVHAMDLDDSLSKSIIMHAIWNEDLDEVKNARMKALHESIKKREKAKECYKEATSPEDLHICARIIGGVKGKIPAYKAYDEKIFQLSKQNILDGIDQWLISAQKEIDCIQTAPDPRMVCSCNFLTRDRPVLDLPTTKPSH